MISLVNTKWQLLFTYTSGIEDISYSYISSLWYSYGKKLIIPYHIDIAWVYLATLIAIASQLVAKCQNIP